MRSLFGVGGGGGNPVGSGGSTWPVKRVAEIPGELVIGGLHMVHEREEEQICGKVMPQGGLQAAEVMLYTVDRVNSSPDGSVMPPGVKLGAYVLDDCDKDTYGLQQAVDFIKGALIRIVALASFSLFSIFPYYHVLVRAEVALATSYTRTYAISVT